jgi:hypothetical protein
MKKKDPKVIADRALIEWVVKKFYSKGKGKECELCRMRDWRKKKAYKEMKIDGIGYFVCYDCYNEEIITQEKKKERKKCVTVEKKKL